MTVLTQLSVGAFATIWWLNLTGSAASLGIAALTSLAVAMLALGGATFHLGRPAHAYRAVKMWRRSWLSREVLLFGLFAQAAAAYAAILWFGLPGAAIAGFVTTMLGIAGVVASAYIYRVPSRPAWNTPLTLVMFILTAATLGPLFAGAVGIGDPVWLATAAVATSGSQLLLLAARFLRCTASDTLELRGTARLLSTVLASRLVARGALLVIGGMVLPLLAVSSASSVLLFAGALAVAIAAEMLGRYLFFVSVVPTHLAAPYLPSVREAA
jgi:formate dehydrogenase iron-sulfur subunit